MRTSLLALLLLALSLGAAPGAAALDAYPLEGPEGRYSGSLSWAKAEGGGTRLERFALRIGSGGFLSLDFPERGLFGYPFPGAVDGGGRISVALPGAEGEAPFALEGRVGADGVLEGRIAALGAEGGFSLTRDPARPSDGIRVGIAVRGGRLAGSLLLPEGPGPHPLALILAGSGATDRDGNNAAVPGRNDALADLALALRDLGVASLRYDKRGSGESLALAPDESSLVFADHVADAEAALRDIAADRRFSSVAVLGHNEGALVGAAAIGAVAPSLAAPRGSRLAVLCASSKGLRESVAEAVAEAVASGAPGSIREEAEGLLDALEAGLPLPEPSAPLADFFRPSFRPYLASWLRYDLVDELERITCPVLLVQGNRDFQVSLSDFLGLARARPEAPAVVLESMNHVLKDVPADLDENYRAFTDPSFPLAEGLAPLLAAFVRGDALPSGLARVDGGVLPGGEAGAEGP